MRTLTAKEYEVIKQIYDSNDEIEVKFIFSIWYSKTIFIISYFTVIRRAISNELF